MASKKKSVNFGDDVISESQFRKVDKDSRDRSKGEGVKVIDISGRKYKSKTPKALCPVYLPGENIFCRNKFFS